MQVSVLDPGNDLSRHSVRDRTVNRAFKVQKANRLLYELLLNRYPSVLSLLEQNPPSTLVDLGICEWRFC